MYKLEFTYDSGETSEVVAPRFSTKEYGISYFDLETKCEMTVLFTSMAEFKVSCVVTGEMKVSSKRFLEQNSDSNRFRR